MPKKRPNMPSQSKRPVIVLVDGTNLIKWGHCVEYLLDCLQDQNEIPNDLRDNLWRFQQSQTNRRKSFNEPIIYRWHKYKGDRNTSEDPSLWKMIGDDDKYLPTIRKLETIVRELMKIPYWTMHWIDNEGRKPEPRFECLYNNGRGYSFDEVWGHFTEPDCFWDTACRLLRAASSRNLEEIEANRKDLFLSWDEVEKIASDFGKRHNDVITSDSHQSTESIKQELKKLFGRTPWHETALENYRGLKKTYKSLLKISEIIARKFREDSHEHFKDEFPIDGDDDGYEASLFERQRDKVRTMLRKKGQEYCALQATIEESIGDPKKSNARKARKRKKQPSKPCSV